MWPFVDGVDHRLDVGVAGEEHPDRVGLELPGMAQEDVAGHAGHALVGEDQVDLLTAEDLQGLDAVARRQDSVRAMEQMAQALEHVDFVVHDQQGVSPLVHPLISDAGRASNRQGGGPDLPPIFCPDISRRVPPAHAGVGRDPLTASPL